jgi:hypothetical protein
MDYDLGINYHPRKVNVVDDALSWRSCESISSGEYAVRVVQRFDMLNLRIVANTEVTEMEVDSTLLQDIRKGQLEDEKIREIKGDKKEEKSPEFTEDDQAMLWYKGRICVLNIKELNDKILQEDHESAYSILLGGNKMYEDLKETYWWYGMKRDVALCDPC